ncbi:MAG: hypothetical protein ACTSP2_04330 [Alphaproteobacteria bacterium]
MAKIRLGSKSFDLPRNRVTRMGLGFAFILGGFLWFLPILGLWMLPLGFLVLAADIPSLRRFNRRFTVIVLSWWNGRKRRRRRRASGVPEKPESG